MKTLNIFLSALVATAAIVPCMAFAQLSQMRTPAAPTDRLLQLPITNTTTDCTPAPKYYDSPPEGNLFLSGACLANTTTPAQTTTTTPQTTTTTIPNTIDSLRQQTAPPGSTITTPEGNTMQAPIIDEATKAQMAATDPFFARFLQISELCSGAGLGQAQMTSQQCVDSLQTGADRWCGLEFYDSLKCQYSTNLVRAFGNLNNVLNSYGFDKIPDISGLLNGP